MMIRKVEIYECIGKGGRYRKLMTAKPAGQATEPAVFYQCESTGEVYWRYQWDFEQRMKLVCIQDDDSRPEAVNEWRGIESAPKDGTSVLVYMPDALGQNVREAHWSSPYEGAPEDQCWWSTPNSPAGVGYTILPHHVTHWQPMPTPQGAQP